MRCSPWQPRWTSGDLELARGCQRFSLFFFLLFWVFLLLVGFSSCSEWGLFSNFSARASGLLFAVASLVREGGLEGAPAQ